MKMSNNVLIIVLLILFIFLMFGVIHKNISPTCDRFLSRDTTRSLTKDGFCLLKNVFDASEVDYVVNQTQDQSSASLKIIKTYIINHQKLLERLYQQCNLNGYEFNDYVFAILGSQISTCHRDFNGTMFHDQLKHPTYTMIIYLHKMKACMDVVPESHVREYTNNYFIDNSKHVICEIGDVLLFNSNLIHTGSIINDDVSNPRIQMKLCHKDDRKHLGFLEDYTRVLDDKPPMNMSTAMSKHYTCQVPFNYVNKDGVTKWYERAFKRLAYGANNALNIKKPST
jgi:hypothetical protein